MGETVHTIWLTTDDEVIVSPMTVIDAVIYSDGTSLFDVIPKPTEADADKFLKGDGTWGTPEGGGDVSNKMDKNNPVGTGSFSLNRKANTRIGDYSFAEGYENTASGLYSHAEGVRCEAGDESSHAEGEYSRATSVASHAEGYESGSTGVASHAEGWYTTASGISSHSEGEYSRAEGTNSHAQNHSTIAKGDSQTSLGKYNVSEEDGRLAVILGNGENGARSNALVMDWNGNIGIKGEIKHLNDDNLTFSNYRSIISTETKTITMANAVDTEINKITLNIGTYLVIANIHFKAGNQKGGFRLCGFNGTSGTLSQNVGTIASSAAAGNYSHDVREVKLVHFGRDDYEYYLNARQNSGAALDVDSVIYAIKL